MSLQIYMDAVLAWSRIVWHLWLRLDIGENLLEIMFWFEIV